jgi:WD40 repeat protein
MHVGEIGDEEVLVATDDSGHVAVHFPQTNSERAPITYKVAQSAWGIDTHSKTFLLAISCNSHIVRLFHLGMGIDGWDWTTTTTDDAHHITLNGHTNNIPSVAFDRSGWYLVSGSLDFRIRLWSCKTGESLRHIHIADGIWSVKFINKYDFKHYQRSYKGTSIKTILMIERAEARILLPSNHKGLGNCDTNESDGRTAASYYSYNNDEENSRSHKEMDLDLVMENQMLLYTTSSSIFMLDATTIGPLSEQRNHIYRPLVHRDSGQYFCTVEVSPLPY